VPAPADDGPDADADGACDPGDNCPATTNGGQANSDADVHGDACDNCPLADNDDQLDFDGDSFGDACDNCVLVDNGAQGDRDSDSVGDDCDICPDDADPGQEDLDGDGFGDACEPPPATSDVLLLVDKLDATTYRMRWDAVPGALAHDLAAGTLDVLKFTGVFDHDDMLRCNLPPGPSSVDVDESPAAGIQRYYLLSVHDSARDNWGANTLGDAHPPSGAIPACR
jgi:hypothetical protein